MQKEKQLRIIHDMETSDFKVSEYRNKILPIINGLSMFQIDKILDDIKKCANGQKVLFEYFPTQS